ncbi:MAG: hypothetical protein AB1609_17495, partial [Bacillota bacterium]
MQQVKVQVESASPGSVGIFVSGAVTRALHADFGLVPVRLAECLGVIAAAKLVLHELKPGVQASLEISANDPDFVRYALRERVPARAEVRDAVRHMWATLDRFARWEIRHERRRKRVLEGGSQAAFPRGLFPWLNPCVAGDGERLPVTLPDCPAVRAQFLASL